MQIRYNATALLEMSL